MMQYDDRMIMLLSIRETRKLALHGTISSNDYQFVTRYRDVTGRLKKAIVLRGWFTSKLGFNNVERQTRRCAHIEIGTHSFRASSISKQLRSGIVCGKDAVPFTLLYDCLNR